MMNLLMNASQDLLQETKEKSYQLKPPVLKKKKLITKKQKTKKTVRIQTKTKRVLQMEADQNQRLFRDLRWFCPLSEV